jgi:hemerythrin-like domain-containing protein
MSALKSLTDEHQMISELLGALSSYAARLRGGASVDPADLMRFSEVFRELVDYRHHEKEEGILLPLLARNGFEWSSGLLAELQRDHGHLRYLIDVLCQAAAKDTVGTRWAGSREERRQIAEAALAFVEFERRHMLREENELFPAIAQRLGADVLQQLGAELAQFDDATGRGIADGSAPPFYQYAADLVQRYSEDSATVDVSGVKWTAAAAKAADVAKRQETLRALGSSQGTSLSQSAEVSAFGRSR